MIITALETFADLLKSKFTLPGSASPEDQLKAPVATAIETAGSTFGLAVSSRTEAHLTDHRVRPDVAIYVGGLICGYIELKAPGLGANAPKLKGKHNKEQWEKLKGLPNLIYTDGREWSLYRDGERKGAIVRFDDDPTDAGKTAISTENADNFEGLIREFLFWKPIVPHKPAGLANYLAPLTRFLRSEVEIALSTSGSNVGLLATEWRQYFFPEADNAQFADAYAQTVTYAMLLARLSGAINLAPTEAAKTLDKDNGLLARALELLGQPGARDELRVGFELLQRSLEALDPIEFLKSKPDLWLYFYEDFLAAYDRKLRNDYGVYYTPREVVELQVRLASELLENEFGKKLGFADDGVVFLDPAVGTGTYLVATVKHALEKVKAYSGEGAVSARASQMAKNMYGFEILVGPYAVAHLRLKQALEGAMNEEKQKEEQPSLLGERLKIYLADTLASPNKAPPGGLDLTHKALTQEHEAARKLKQGGDILVCIGNPPYDRQNIEEGDTRTQRKGDWVRFGDQVQGGAKQEEQGERPILTDFTEPATKAGAGVHLKNLYNDYIYFWRWALWRLFEQQNCGGIVTFITASSYLAGPGFVGVREMMRRTFDDLWILDLGGDNLGTRKTPNVFNIQTPVAIAIGIRSNTKSSNTPARVRYAKIGGVTREDKLSVLEAIDSLASVVWTDCPNDWHKPFLPIGDGDYFDWPQIRDIFPWAHTGAQFQRTWPIAEEADVLAKRWQALLASDNTMRAKLFKNSRDRDIDYQSRDGSSGEPLADLSPTSPMPVNRPYSFRSYDLHHAIIDTRVGDYIRFPLIKSESDSQIFLCSLITEALGHGQAGMVAAHLPDLNFFHGRHGMVMPLYRDAGAAEPNVTGGLLGQISAMYESPVNAEDLVAYVYALFGGQSYTSRFWNELETPGPRVPLTTDAATFATTATLGRRLIWLHTYAERFRGQGRDDSIPPGSAKNVKAVSSNTTKYPVDYTYDLEKREVCVGDGRFGPVKPEVWEFEVSGLKVVQSWLGYRMKVRAGKKSSPLDDIRPASWTPRMTDEFLKLLWVLEASLAMEPELVAALDKVVAGECFRAIDLPQPTDAERKAPAPKVESGSLLSLMGGDSSDEGED
ncbi:type ISP restriction/modification enzyme [Bradyrhizobium sp.]|uniref:type ISP restriction/modification enzyme n=1 Tax=Bradyrhizobium sp. TaxID=376 RepID=UPI002E00C451|nr:type ISP restriction/modification enzyme [Bradyrhizobium sp.]